MSRTPHSIQYKTGVIISGESGLVVNLLSTHCTFYSLFLLKVKQRNAISISQQQTSRACVEYVLHIIGRDLLAHLIAQVLNYNLQEGRKKIILYYWTEEVYAFRGFSRLTRSARLLLTVCVRSSTANRFLATQTEDKPEDLFPSGASGFWESLSLGIVCRS